MPFSRRQKAKAALEDNSASISAGAAASKLRKRFLHSKATEQSLDVIEVVYFYLVESFSLVRFLCKAFFSVCMRFLCRSFRFSTWECEILLVWALLALSHFFSLPSKASVSVSLRYFLASWCLCFSRLVLSFFSPPSLNFGFLELDIVKGIRQEKKRKRKCPNEVSSCVLLGLQAPESCLVQVRVLLPYSSIKGLLILTPSKIPVWFHRHCADKLICRGWGMEERNALLFNKIVGRHQWASLCLVVGLPALYQVLIVGQKLLEWHSCFAIGRTFFCHVKQNPYGKDN